MYYIYKTAKSAQKTISQNMHLSNTFNIFTKSILYVVYLTETTNKAKVTFCKTYYMLKELFSLR